MEVSPVTRTLTTLLLISTVTDREYERHTGGNLQRSYLPTYRGTAWRYNYMLECSQNEGKFVYAQAGEGSVNTWRASCASLALLQIVTKKHKKRKQLK